MDSRFQAFKTEMTAAERALNLAEHQLDYKTVDSMKSYISFLRRCYHGETFQNHTYKSGDDFDIDIAISMQGEFLQQYPHAGIGKVAVQMIWDYIIINNTINSFFKESK